LTLQTAVSHACADLLTKRDKGWQDFSPDKTTNF